MTITDAIKAINAALEEKNRHRRVYPCLVAACITRSDLHGVVDACNDLRVIDAEIETLEWVLDLLLTKE